MAETFTPVLPVQVDYICDACGKGSLKPTGEVKTSNPPWYVHQCKSCLQYSSHRNQYPYIKYEAVNDNTTPT